VSPPDPLTGLVTRAGLLDRLRLDLSADSGARIGLVCLDLDGFKQVNDRYGHDAGDEVLRGLSTRLTGLVRADDVVARLGGDEFAVLVRAAGRGYDLAAVARRMRDALAQPYRVPPHGDLVECSASVGFARVDAPAQGGSLDPDVSAAALLRAADQAMYAAKGAPGPAVVDAQAPARGVRLLPVRHLDDGRLLRLAARPSAPLPADTWLSTVLRVALDAAAPVPVSLPLAAEHCLSAAAAHRLVHEIEAHGLAPNALAVEVGPPAGRGPTATDGRAVLADAGVAVVLADAAGRWPAWSLVDLRPDEVVLDGWVLSRATDDAAAHAAAAGFVAFATAVTVPVTADLTVDRSGTRLASSVGCRAAVLAAVAPQTKRLAS
jgi:diguanylate cyclase (GGDEF)-like protein